MFTEFGQKWYCPLRDFLTKFTFDEHINVIYSSQMAPQTYAYQLYNILANKYY